MKKYITLLFSLFLFVVIAKSQIRDLIVEKYYISDSLDASDSTNYYADASYLTPILPVGSTAYRVYVQLESGFRIKKIYGTACNPLKIESTANFYNNIDRPSASFGYLLNKSWYLSNPTLMLDSWLTIGLATKAHKGVLKAEDYDGSIIMPSWGGTSSILGGILNNNDPLAGIPIDTADGLAVKSGLFTTWSDFGIKDISAADTTVFGPSNVGSKFISTNAYLQQNAGVNGDSVLLNNKILIAQLTTTGELTLQLNLELLDSLGNTYNFISQDCGVPLTGDTAVSSLLKYPPICGCKDPNFLEYNANFSCADSAACLTKIIFGCMDTLACNYSSSVNYNIQSLCCYPGNCNNRDISLVCPSISTDSGLQLFPNPASQQISLQFSAGSNNQIKYSIYDCFGMETITKDLGNRSGSILELVDISSLHLGLYFVQLSIGANIQNITFMKQ